MKNKENWKPSFYLVEGGKLKVNREFVKEGSSLIVDIGCEILNENLPRFAKGKLLDLGCGFVPLYEFYKNSVTENICVDWENSLHKNEILDVTCDISKPLPFSDNEFDSILSTAVLEHIYEPIGLIKECNRILKTGGNLILSSNFSYWEHEAPNDYLRHTQYFFKKAAEENGFKIKVLEPIGDGMCVISDILEKISYSGRKNKWPLKILHKITDAIARYYWFKKRKPLFKEQPLGYFVVMEKVSNI